MANTKHLKILKQGVEAWNKWREENPKITPDLRNAKFKGAKLSGVNFSQVDLRMANLNNSDLSNANLKVANLVLAELTKTNLAGADLSWAKIYETKLYRTNLSNATLNHTRLIGTIFWKTYLKDSDFEFAHLAETIFTDVNLSDVKNLGKCNHYGPSNIDHRTLMRSGDLPKEFLSGSGLPDSLIEYYHSLLNQPIQRYSCFISFSSKDDEFLKKLLPDLRDNGVTCYFAPEDLKIGDKIRIGIDEAIRVHDKLLLILSKNSINSQWVEQEVEKALEKERDETPLVLFPIRIDDSVFDTKDGWAPYVKNSRDIGDFSNWKDHDSYKKAFDRLLRDLKRMN